MLPINMEIHVLLFILEINLLCSDYLYNNYATQYSVNPRNRNSISSRFPCSLSKPKANK